MSKGKVKRGVFEEQEVDFDFLMSLVESDLRQVSRTDDLIDKFLEIKDLKIVVEDDRVNESVDLPDPSDDSDFDDLPSEELARIYYSQGLYPQAKEIYNQLFLLYSEKITYFATQIANLSEKEAAERGEKGSVSEIKEENN